MRRKAFGLGYGVLMMATLLWIVCSNQIIGSWGDNHLAKKVEFADYWTNDRVHFNIEQAQGINNLIETVRISGWAFVETEYENEDSYVELLLVSDECCYRLDHENQISGSYTQRSDVLEAFPEMNIGSKYVGFMFDFPSFTMKDGIYDVYIYRWENAHNYGLVKTGKQLVKNREQIQFQNQQ